MTGNIHKAPNPPQVMAQLFFGGNVPSGGMVTDDAFAAFLAGYVTPSFPGFTVTTSQGYWKGVPETVRVLSLLRHRRGKLSGKLAR